MREHRAWNRRVWTRLLLGIALGVSAGASASPPLINYQGRVTDTAGVPLQGPAAMVFRVYDAVSGGTVLWGESQTLNVQSGLFDVLLGFGDLAVGIGEL